jgi:hypothetical protein
MNHIQVSLGLGNFMGGDDFQKRGSDLGLRDMISKKRQERENKKQTAIDYAVDELIRQMQIFEEVEMAVSLGCDQVTIAFPVRVRNLHPESRYFHNHMFDSGISYPEIPVTTKSIIKHFESLMKEEEVGIEIRFMSTKRGCCSTPKRKRPDGWIKPKTWPVGGQSRLNKTNLKKRMSEWHEDCAVCGNKHHSTHVQGNLYRDIILKF